MSSSAVTVQDSRYSELCPFYMYYKFKGKTYNFVVTSVSVGGQHVKLEMYPYRVDLETDNMYKRSIHCDEFNFVNYFKSLVTSLITSYTAAEKSIRGTKPSGGGNARFFIRLKEPHEDMTMRDALETKYVSELKAKLMVVDRDYNTKVQALIKTMSSSIPAATMEDFDMNDDVEEDQFEIPTKKRSRSVDSAPTDVKFLKTDSEDMVATTPQQQHAYQNGHPFIEIDEHNDFLLLFQGEWFETETHCILFVQEFGGMQLEVKSNAFSQTIELYWKASTNSDVFHDFIPQLFGKLVVSPKTPPQELSQVLKFPKQIIWDSLEDRKCRKGVQYFRLISALKQ